MTNRELDALFAEKVLGCKVRWQDDGPWCGCDNGKPHQEWGHGDIERLRWDDDPDGGLLYFTSSIDAAWEGMQQLSLAVSERRRLWEDTSDGSRPYHAEVGEAYACANHPAHALVLACLRAVGVECD